MEIYELIFVVIDEVTELAPIIWEDPLDPDNIVVELSNGRVIETRRSYHDFDNSRNG